MTRIFKVKNWLFVVAAFLLLACVALFLTRNSSLLYAQTIPAVAVNQTAEKNKQILVVESAQAFSTNSAFVSAVRRNAELKNSILWAFGGKPQRGWYLYESLISQLISAEAPVNSDGFAEALSRWQQAAGLEPNGVLDDNALSVMVKTWQSNRLKLRGYPSPDELLIAPATDFWDSARADELRQVERETYAAYKKMVAAAVADKSLKLAANADGSLADSEKFLKIISGFRSKEYQAKLRQASPNSGRAGLAVNSPHFTGRALDIYVGGEPVNTKDANRAIQVNTPVYKWLVKNAGKFGFKPYFYEPWHWEYAPDELNQ